MAKKAPCRCKRAECEECPEWIFTFADLVMLMMGFFVILWVLKPSGNPKASDSAAATEAQAQWNQTVIDIRQAFGYKPKPGSNDPIDVMMEKQLATGARNAGRTRQSPDGATGIDPLVKTIRVGKTAVVGGRLSFDKGSAKLSDQLTPTLNEIADQIRGHRSIVMVKGNTSLDDFDDKATAEQKMDLSLKRAQAVADYLTQNGVSPDILRVQGCSTFEPVVQRQYDELAQAANRRVEVEVTPTLVSEMQADDGSGKAGGGDGK